MKTRFVHWFTALPYFLIGQIYTVLVAVSLHRSGYVALSIIAELLLVIQVAIVLKIVLFGYSLHIHMTPRSQGCRNCRKREEKDGGK